MSDAITILLVGIASGTVGWFLRMQFERRWAKKDRKAVRTETEKQQQLELLRELTGKLHARFVWLRQNHAHSEAGKAADEIAGWLYEHRSRFPDAIAGHFIKLSVNVYTLCKSVLVQNPSAYALLLSLMDRENTTAWDAIKEYKRKLESELFE